MFTLFNKPSADKVYMFLLKSNMIEVRKLTLNTSDVGGSFCQEYLRRINNRRMQK